MASFFNLTLDTTAPSGGNITIIERTNTPNISATLAAVDATQMKLWGDIAETAGGTAITEATASWVSYATTASIILTDGDGTKTVHAKFRDDVGNESAAVSASTVLDTAGATVTVVGPDKARISKVNGYNVATFSFSADEEFVEWTVRVVPSNGSAHTAGTEIPTTAGSTNMHGTTATAADASISCTINGADLEAASSGDGAKIIKVFVKDTTGNWSA